MLLYVGFPEDEMALLKQAAEKLGVTDRCNYISEIGSLDDSGKIVNLDSLQAKLPSVIFLNLDSKTESWQTSLLSMKSHKRLKGLPIVGLGRLPDNQILELYDMRINSYIRKPETFDEMMRAASISLEYWLEFTQLPAPFIAEL